MLAGGLSARFGSDKALFPVHGQPAVLYLAQLFRSVGLLPVIVGRVPRGLGVLECLEPSWASRHPLFGVAAALGEGDALVCPCDLWDLQVGQLQKLLDSGYCVAKGQPLLAILPQAEAGRALAWAQAGRSVRSFVEGYSVVDVGELRNYNVLAAIAVPGMVV